MFSTTKAPGVVSGGPSDPFFNAVTLLLSGNGTNGAQNNTFTDTSGNSISVARNGAPPQGTFSPFSRTAGYWSNYLSGTTSYLTLSSTDPMSFGTGAFTIEGWVLTGERSVSVGASRTILGNSGNGYTMQLYIDSSNGRLIFGNTGSTNIQGSSNIANNVWHHVVVVRDASGNIAIFVDGIREAVSTNSQNYASSTIYIGAFDPANGFWNGYISNLRIVKGTAVYSPTSTTLTVPITPLTAVTNTALLTCQANRFFDASANTYTVTPTSTVSVQVFSPFNPATAYTTIANGGSIYFDGAAGTYLTFPNSSLFAFGTGAFTIEFWINMALMNDKFILGGRSSIGTMLITTGGFSGTTAGVLRYVASSTIVSSNVITDSGWHHCAIVRAAGNNVTLYVDGVSRGTGTDTTNYTATSGTWYLGTNDVSPGGNIPTGYISGLRIVKGTAVYTSNFTPPTAPPTAITNTSLLLNFTNAGVFDNAAMNDLTTVGSAQISTAQAKFGTGSISFNGTNSALTAPYSVLLNYGLAAFTIEFFVNFSDLSSNKIILDTYTSAAAGGGYQIYWRLSGQSIAFYANGVVVAQSSFNSHVTGTWYHVAVTRDSANTLRIFIDGTQYASVAYSSDINVATSAMLALGYQRTTGTNWFNGYLDDVRVTKGYARYTANFTPPTAALPTR